MFTLLLTARKLTFAPVAPWPLIVGAVLLLALLSVYLYSRPRADFSPRRRHLLILLRILAFLCLVLVLLQPSISIKSRDSRRPKVLVLVDGSASMGLPYLPGEASDSVRSREAVAAQFSSALLRKLPRRFDKQLFVFSDTLAEADPQKLTEAGSPRSALGLALTEAAARIGDAPAAVVLVSDGASSYGPDPSGVARTLPFPVYTVSAAEEGRFRDVEVTDVLSPATVFVGSDIPVLVRLKGQGLENLLVPVTISESGLPVSTSNVRLAGSAQSELMLSVRPASAGVHFYEVSVPVVKGEVSRINNTKRFAVEAVSEKLKVVYFEGELTWDFRFLKRALESDPRLDTNFSLVGGWKAGSPNVRNVSTEIPAGVGGAAVVVVGDGAGGRMSDGLWQRVADFVSSGGGILFAGDDGLGQAPAAARELLPVVLRPPQNWGPKVLLDVTVTEQGVEHPVCQVENDPALIREAWKDVSPLMGVASVERAKPGAEVLLEGHSEERVWPLLVAGSFGRGRVLFAGASGIWRWNFTLPGVGGSKRLYPGLVSNTVSWLSETGAQRRFAVLPAKWVFESGDDVQFLVRGADDTSAVRVDVRGARGSEAATLNLGSTAGGRVAGAAGRSPSLGRLAPGTYSYAASSSRAGETLSYRGSFVVDTTGAEDRSLFPDPRLLSYVAQASGGKSFRAGETGRDRVDEGQLDRLVREISVFGEKVVVERQVRLWNNPLLLIVFTCLLALEWWLRRRWGLP